MKKGKSNSKKLESVLDLEKKQIREVETEIKELKKIDREEHESIKLEKEELKELAELKELDLKIKAEIGEHPLRRITYKDVGKSMIGAFIGIVSHFTVLEGLNFAESISLAKANFFYFISFLVGLLMLYYSGFRKVSDVRLFVILPLRLILVYAVTIISIIIVLYIFGGSIVYNQSLYREVAVLSLPAIIGACAVDLIGRD